MESELGQGSCFEVLIDLRIAEDRSVSSTVQEEKNEQNDNIFQGMRFLCAEDNELNAEILTELLKIEGRSSHELAKKIPIIAMTANAFSEDIQHSLAAGMNAHVSKPVEMRVLEKTIRSIKTGGGAKLKALINNH